MKPNFPNLLLPLANICRYVEKYFINTYKIYNKYKGYQYYVQYIIINITNG